MRRLLFSALAREDLHQVTRYIARASGRARSFVVSCVFVVISCSASRIKEYPEMKLPKG